MIYIWELHFEDDTIILVNSKRVCTTPSCWVEFRRSVVRRLIRHLILKVEYFTRCELKFSHIPEMNNHFMGDPGGMTYEWYLKQPNPMIEWCLIKKIWKNP